jgi:hypothetical protein
MVMFLSILVLLGFGLYRRGQNKMKAQLYASMVEPTEAPTEAPSEEEPGFDWDGLDSSPDPDESSEVELELVEVETDEDSL